jgi:AcrR family transcriptional regulator
MVRDVEQDRSMEQRLLEVAIDQFGEKGLDGASTRAIAAAAGTTMSSITYHFGGKEGLYLAAARCIADQMGERMGPSLASSEELSRQGPPHEACTKAVLAILDRFLEAIIRPESTPWARFILREQMEPTAAFEILYGGVMGRVIHQVAALVERIGEGRWSGAEARLKTLAILGQALVFRLARAALLRTTGWADIDADGLAAIRQVVHAHTQLVLGDGVPR